MTFNVFAIGYSVLNVEGTVTYQDGNSWKPLEVGQELDKETIINVGLNSTAKIAYGRFIINIKPMKKGTVEKLTSDVLESHKITKSNVAPASVKSKKAVITAASRASDAMEDLDWDEDEYYEID